MASIAYVIGMMDAEAPLSHRMWRPSCLWVYINYQSPSPTDSGQSDAFRWFPTIFTG